MRRRRRKKRGFARLLGYALALLWVEEALWGGLGALAPESRERIAVGTAVVRAEMRRWGVRDVGIRGLTRAEVAAVRRRLGLDGLFGFGPTRLDVRLGTSRRVGDGRYDVDARASAKWAKGGRLVESRFEVRVHRGAATVVRRRPAPFREANAPYRLAGMLPI